MNNIYQEAVRAVENGARFTIDFRSRSLKLNDKHIIQDGQYEGELGVPHCSGDEFFTSVEELYRRYKHSIPSERSQSKSHRYFTALPEKSLEDEAMLYGERRDKAQIELELYVLCQILGGLEWNPETMGKWFWKSETDKDLVILRNWVEPDKNQSLTVKTKKHEKRENSMVPPVRHRVRGHKPGIYHSGNRGWSGGTVQAL